MPPTGTSPPVNLKPLEDRCEALEREVLELKHREEEKRLEFEQLKKLLNAIRAAVKI